MATRYPAKPVRSNPRYRALFPRRLRRNPGRYLRFWDRTQHLCRFDGKRDRGPSGLSSDAAVRTANLRQTTATNGTGPSFKLSSTRAGLHNADPVGASRSSSVGSTRSINAGRVARHCAGVRPAGREELGAPSTLDVRATTCYAEKVLCLAKYFQFTRLALVGGRSCHRESA